MIFWFRTYRTITLLSHKARLSKKYLSQHQHLGGTHVTPSFNHEGDHGQENCSDVGTLQFSSACLCTITQFNSFSMDVRRTFDFRITTQRKSLVQPESKPHLPGGLTYIACQIV